MNREEKIMKYSISTTTRISTMIEEQEGSIKNLISRLQRFLSDNKLEDANYLVSIDGIDWDFYGISLISESIDKTPEQLDKEITEWEKELEIKKIINEVQMKDRNISEKDIRQVLASLPVANFITGERS